MLKAQSVCGVIVVLQNAKTASLVLFCLLYRLGDVVGLGSWTHPIAACHI